MLTLQELRNLARLSKLDFLTDNDLTELATELNQIFTYIDKLKNAEIKTSKSNYQLVKSNRFLSDKNESDFNIDSYLSRVSNKSDRYISTKKVL